MERGPTSDNNSLDGVQVGDRPGHSLKQPFMFMDSEANAGMNGPVYEEADNLAYRVMTQGTQHLKYSDFSLWSPLFKETRAPGSIDGRRAVEIMNAYPLAFFDKHLKGEPEPLLDGPPREYPEVRFGSRNTSTGPTINKY